MVRLNVECKDFGKNIFIINYLFINFNMLYFIFKKKYLLKLKYYLVVIYFKDF